MSAKALAGALVPLIMARFGTVVPGVGTLHVAGGVAGTSFLVYCVTRASPPIVAVLSSFAFGRIGPIGGAFVGGVAVVGGILFLRQRF